MNEQKELKDFFAAYFHEDWPEEAKDAAGLLDLYLAQNVDADARRRLAHAIETFAARHGSDAALEQAIVSELGGLLRAERRAQIGARMARGDRDEVEPVAILTL